LSSPGYTTCGRNRGGDGGGGSSGSATWGEGH
jgi:hypothetical protein